MKDFITIEYFRIKGKIKKAFQFWNLYLEWCKIYDDILNKELQK